MAKFDYTELVETAIELIEEFGTVANMKQLDGSARNPMRPEQGQRGQVFCSELKNVPMVFVDAATLGEKIVTEDMLKDIEKIAIVSPLFDGVEDMDVLETDGAEYAVRWVKKLKPATKTLVFIVGLST